MKPGRENVPTTRLRSPFFRFHPYGYNFYLNLFSYGFTAAVRTRASISFFVTAGEHDDILVSRTIQIIVREQLNPLIA